MKTHATVEPVSKQWIGKHTIGILLETVFSIRSVQSGYKDSSSGVPTEQLVET
jgi:hypothetical protein